MISTHGVLMALPEVAAHMQRGDAKAYELRRKKPTPKYSDTAARLAVVELVGPIDADSAAKVIGGLHAAERNDQIGGVAFLIDSGGGYADSAAAIAEVVREVAEIKPVHVHVGGTMASGAYYAAAHATSITASEWSTVGSIGTYSVLVDTSEALRRVGIRFILVKAGAFKATGLPGVEISDEMIADTERVVTSVNRLFLAAVASGRGLAMQTVLRDLATGQTWLGREAHERGLVDEVKPITAWMAELSRRHPPEEFVDLHDEAAVAKACELLKVKSLRDADVNALVALRANCPTLVERAKAYKPFKYRTAN